MFLSEQSETILESGDIFLLCCGLVIKNVFLSGLQKVGNYRS